MSVKCKIFVNDTQHMINISIMYMCVQSEDSNLNITKDISMNEENKYGSHRRINS